MSASTPVEPRHNIDQLIHDLGSHDGSVRHAARVALVTIGLPAIPGLIEALSAPNDEARWEAAKTLTEVRDKRAIPGLLNLLMDDAPGTRWLAAEALAYLGRAALEPLLRGLIEHSGSPWFREGAHHILRQWSTGALRDVLAPVLHALEGIEPDIGALVPAHELLKKLHAAGS